MLINSELIPHIYRSSSVLELIDNVNKFELIPYCNDPLKYEQFEKMIEYKDIIVDLNYLSITRMYFNELYEVISGKFPEIKFFLEGRRKSFVNFFEKMIDTQKKGKPLDTLKDIYGYRIVTLDSSIDLLYELTSLLIKFFVEIKGFSLSKTKVTESGNFKPEEHPEIIVPEKSLLPNKHRKYVKDYVADPKRNGYQSLHMVLLDPIYNRFLEIQIRNFQMHANSESGKANHTDYKNKKKENPDISKTELDLSKINMDGFIATSEPERPFFDEIGLIKSISLLVRHKTHSVQKRNIITI